MPALYLRGVDHTDAGTLQDCGSMGDQRLPSCNACFEHAQPFRAMDFYCDCKIGVERRSD